MRKAREVEDTLERGSPGAMVEEHPEITAPPSWADAPEFTNLAAPDGGVPAGDADSAPPPDQMEERRGRKRYLRPGVAILCCSGILISAIVIARRRRARATPIRRFVREARKRVHFS